jgi:hypothetical protein
MIKRVGIAPKGTGQGMLFFGPLTLAFGLATVYTPIGGNGGGAVPILFVLTFLCAWGVRSSYRAVNTSQVWLQTGVLPVFIFTSMDKNEAEAVKDVLEQAISQHRPVSAGDAAFGRAA